MADLMVTSESHFRGALVVRVARTDPAGVEFSVLCDDADWFAADDPLADPDGWVRGVRDITLDGQMHFGAVEVRERAYEQLTRWCEGDVPVDVISSVQHQATVILDRASGTSVAVKMSADSLDRA